MNWPSLSNPDGRRAWAFAAIVIGCGVMTGFAAFGVWLLRGNAEYTFWLALAAHAQIMVGMTALSAQLVRRTIKAGKDGIEISDQEAAPLPTVKVSAEVKP